MAHENVDHYGGVHYETRELNREKLFHRIVCGHCGADVGAAVIAESGPTSWLRCPICGGGIVLTHHAGFGVRARTYFVQHPSRLPEADIEHLPSATEKAYEEARRCFSVGAYGATEMVCRKILSHVAVDHEAPAGLRFIEYVQHLEATGLITPPMKRWAGLIRTHGNAAVHDLEEVDRDRAAATLGFTAQLLRIAYEMPGMANRFLNE